MKLPFYKKLEHRVILRNAVGIQINLRIIAKERPNIRIQ
jgi:hypothetical protein